MSDADLPLFAWSPSETPAKFKRAKGDPRDYAAEWSAFVEDFADIAANIRQRAEILRRNGVARIEVNALFALARQDYATSVNNSWRAACADWLVAQDPRLDALIERRARRRTK